MRPSGCGGARDARAWTVGCGDQNRGCVRGRLRLESAYRRSRTLDERPSRQATRMQEAESGEAGSTGLRDWEDEGAPSGRRRHGQGRGDRQTMVPRARLALWQVSREYPLRARRPAMSAVDPLLTPGCLLAFSAWAVVRAGCRRWIPAVSFSLQPPSTSSAHDSPWQSLLGLHSPCPRMVAGIQLPRDKRPDAGGRRRVLPQTSDHAVTFRASCVSRRGTEPTVHQS